MRRSEDLERGRRADFDKDSSDRKKVPFEFVAKKGKRKSTVYKRKWADREDLQSSLRRERRRLGRADLRKSN